MPITLLSIGSQGDFQPFLALACGLKAAGFPVKLASAAHFAEQATTRGIDFVPMRADYLRLLQSESGKSALSKNPWAAQRQLRETVEPMAQELLDDCWQATDDATALIVHPKVLAGPHLAEKRGIPIWIGFFLPILTPTGDYPFPLLPIPSLGRWLNRQSYRILSLASMPFRKRIQTWRTETLGLPATRNWDANRLADGTPIPIWYAFSPELIPRASDWGDEIAITGSWELPANPSWNPPESLTNFLATGDPPVYFGFGSMVAEHSEPLTRTIIDTIESLGIRAIIASGWGGLQPPNDHPQILGIDAAPHDWLFPQCAAIVHHGGAGTTHAAARSGKPMLICPFFADQPFWGKRMQQLGVAEPPIPIRRVTVANLTRAVRALLSWSERRHRAESLGQRMQRENGIAPVIESLRRAGFRPQSSGESG
ncbi:glycosyltransferase [Tuwongella immobilis]|uniref:Uncharacterized protein n=1 Tax=Tuwongella immobilis TaxID=692036 RepID=A0A6C2YN63_9BACT|nr:glycosyltransferase [Tuwongella immobilis]VIP02563.1 udp-glucose:sterol glucosyltransferase : Glycosyl transferase, UDP-glucuronosyltransferase OS=Microcoleus sp. PCC 7113 GN=Mic7113_1036 PE=4 SV=1: Glyco_transf_28: UDPGT [Tuwongella immobilis]VTS01778.1 udp-glucose:sterol glucosyltransferase : Glycosyl transferase, UDP-glucuronosyltransferase OS=Microcoleus sp. PCC 7113 GN=Mic7113_1036 PE=4 SV=1: Glyco_transf_28: UDPGT [Tuwongella immobilis]